MGFGVKPKPPKPIVSTTRPRVIPMPPPSGDLSIEYRQSRGSGSSKPLDDKLRAVAEWQKQNGMEPVPVSDRFGHDVDSMTPSIVEETTQRKEAGRYYEPEHVQEVIDIADEQGPPVLSDGEHGLPDSPTPYAERAERPLFVVTRTGGEPENYSLVVSKLRRQAGDEPAFSGMVVQRRGKGGGTIESEIRSHEFGHNWSPVLGHAADDHPIEYRAAVRSLVESNPEFQKYPELLSMVAGHLAYKTKMSEMLATANQLRRMEYAMTGKLPRTEAQRMALLDKWSTSKPASLGEKPNQRSRYPWPDDEVYRYGPRAGQPATHMKSIQEYMREALMAMPPDSDEMGDFIELFNRGASNSKPNPNVAHA